MYNKETKKISGYVQNNHIIIKNNIFTLIMDGIKYRIYTKIAKKALYYTN